MWGGGGGRGKQGEGVGTTNGGNLGISFRSSTRVLQKVCHWVRITSVLRFIKHIFITNLQSIPPLLKHIFVTFYPVAKSR